MSHRASAKFWRFYAALSENIRRLANENYKLLKRDPPTILRFISRKSEGFSPLESVFTTERLPLKMARILCGFGLATTASTNSYSIDQRVMHMESTNGYVQRRVAAATDAGVTRAFTTTVQGQPVLVDPAKSLFMFMQRLWFDLETHSLHPGFDALT